MFRLRSELKSLRIQWNLGERQFLEKVQTPLFGEINFSQKSKTPIRYPYTPAHITTHATVRQVITCTKHIFLWSTTFTDIHDNKYIIAINLKINAWPQLGFLICVDLFDFVVLLLCVWCVWVCMIVFLLCWDCRMFVLVLDVLNVFTCCWTNFQCARMCFNNKNECA